ncbi:MAG: DNA-directed DNA polymerase II small subunit [Candidatus Micrarchaeota archaeon]|nr:DNA-directed DNA polymerase II small subunit [Candidatus Micrarchaeota archaeon]
MLQKVESEGFLLEAGVEHLITSEGINVDALIEFAKCNDEFIISTELVHRFKLLQEQQVACVEKPVEVERPVFRALASEYPSRIEHLKEHDVSGRSTCKGQVDDFVSLFRDRYRRISSILRLQPSQNAVSSYTGAKRGERCRFIGLVRSKTATKNGHLIIEAEDEHGVLKVFVGKGNKELMGTCAGIILDEVVAFDGQYRDPFFYADSVVWPDIPLNKPKRQIEENLSIAFLSDIHVGSNLFMRDNFERMLRWLGGDGGCARGREIASTIKYIFIAGDLVDGIGVYPGQERELAIQDIYGQYDMLFSLLEQIPDYITTVIVPGNHDAVRRGDPQPRLPAEFVKRPRGNYIFGSSPSLFKVEGFTSLIYHGNSIDSMIASVPGLSYSEPEKAMVEYLKRRHLSPIYGSNHLIPENEDYMAISEVPDIMHMGHVHKNGYADYRNIAVINSGTWQSQTDYQRMQGHIPTPCLLPVYNLKDNSLRVMDFNSA